MFDGKKILITGGTGSLGYALTKRLLTYNVETIRILSRNEHQQIEMRKELQDNRLRFFIGDVRDKDRLITAFEDIDIVFHAAALKHVDVIEYNPFEGIKTNVLGSQNVIDASISQNIERVICIGTDKAVSPLNTYGATKLLMEKLFVTANNYLNKKKHRTKFIALRYGNVLGSSGSVLPLFINQIKNNQDITITDPHMTRFSITMNEVLDFIIDATILGKGSEIFVPKLRAYSIIDIKNALESIMGKINVKNIGIRDGEKINEVLINKDELRNTFEINDKYVILNQKHNQDNYDNLKNINLKDNYSSDAVEKIPINELITIFSELISEYKNLKT